MNVLRTLATGSAAALLALVPASAYASHGADDAPGHHSGGDDRTTSARHGADDGPNHHRRHGNDDGPNHHRRHGNDDGPNHHRHGNDDGPHHR